MRKSRSPRGDGGNLCLGTCRFRRSGRLCAFLVSAATRVHVGSKLTVPTILIVSSARDHSVSLRRRTVRPSRGTRDASLGRTALRFLMPGTPVLDRYSLMSPSIVKSQLQATGVYHRELTLQRVGIELDRLCHVSMHARSLVK